MFITIIVTLIIGSSTGYIENNVLSKGDFSAFYSAGVIVNESCKDNNSELYDIWRHKEIQEEAGIIEADEMPTAFLNPPLLAWLMSPFSNTSYVLALNIWRFITVLIALLSVIVLTKKLKLELNWWDSFIVLAVSLPFTSVIINGQNTFLFVGLYVISYLLLTSNHNFSAGLFLGLGALKPQLFLFVPVVLFFQKKWDALFGFVVGVMLIISVSVLLIGSEGFIDYMGIFDTDMYSYGIQTQVAMMHSFPAFIRLIFGAGINVNQLFIVTTSGLAILFGYYSYFRNYRFDINALLSLSILGSLIAAPHLFHYDLSLLIIPFLFIYSWTTDNSQSINSIRNYRLALAALFIFLWMSIIVTDIIRVQFSVLLILYLFMIILKRPGLN